MLLNFTFLIFSFFNVASAEKDQLIRKGDEMRFNGNAMVTDRNDKIYFLLTNLMELYI